MPQVPRDRALFPTSPFKNPQAAPTPGPRAGAQSRCWPSAGIMAQWHPLLVYLKMTLRLAPCLPIRKASTLPQDTISHTVGPQDPECRGRPYTWASITWAAASPPWISFPHLQNGLNNSPHLQGAQSGLRTTLKPSSSQTGCHHYVQFAG